MLANMAQHEGPHTCSILLFGCYAIFAAAPEATGSKAGSKGTVFSIMGAPVAPVPGGLRPAENRLRPERSSSPSTIFDGSWGERFRYSAGGGLPLHPRLYPGNWVTRRLCGFAHIRGPARSQTLGAWAPRGFPSRGTKSTKCCGRLCNSASTPAALTRVDVRGAH